MLKNGNQVDVISSEDKEFIRLLTAMPMDMKLLAKGFILGLKADSVGQGQSSA